MAAAGDDEMRDSPFITEEEEESKEEEESIILLRRGRVCATADEAERVAKVFCDEMDVFAKTMVFDIDQTVLEHCSPADAKAVGCHEVSRSVIPLSDHFRFERLGRTRGAGDLHFVTARQGTNFGYKMALADLADVGLKTDKEHIHMRPKKEWRSQMFAKYSRRLACLPTVGGRHAINVGDRLSDVVDPEGVKMLMHDLKRATAEWRGSGMRRRRLVSEWSSEPSCLAGASTSDDDEDDIIYKVDAEACLNRCYQLGIPKTSYVVLAGYDRASHVAIKVPEFDNAIR